MINEKALGLASAATAAVFWFICSLLVYSMPNMTMNVTGYMAHADLSAMNWHMPFFGFLNGLIVWSAACGLFGWMVGVFYNWFNRSSESE